MTKTESSKNYTRLDKVKVMQGLETALHEMVERMKHEAMNSYSIMTDKQVENFENKAVADEPFDNWDAIQINDGVYCVNRITNIPHLVIQFRLSCEQEKRFLELENASLYVKDEVCRGEYTIDCGGDYQKAAYLYSEVARLVFLFDGERNFLLRNFLKWIDNPASFHMEFQFSPEKLNGTENAEEITKEVEAYNRKATQKGAPLLAWDVATGTLTGDSVEGKRKSGLAHSLKRGLYAAFGKGLPTDGNAMRRCFWEICFLCETATYLYNKDDEEKE